VRLRAVCKIARCVDGAANSFTAAILKLAGNQPASACTPAVKALEAQLDEK
jgi:hypothetical protein